MIGIIGVRSGQEVTYWERREHWRRTICQKAKRGVFNVPQGRATRRTCTRRRVASSGNVMIRAALWHYESDHGWGDIRFLTG